MRIDPKVYAALSPEDKAYVDRELAAYESLVSRNPLQAFEPHSPAQREFLQAGTPIIAAFAGNRFGKTTSLVVKALVEACDRDCLPSMLREWKRFEAPTSGWIVVPTTDKLYDTLLPALQKWVPKDQLVGKGWKDSWSKERRQLTFKNGSILAFKTYEQDPSTLGGAALHYVGYDEPPPRATRDECLMRLADYNGYEMFAMTPLKTNTGWVRRDIYKKRASPEITVIRGTIHDNPTLSKAKVKQILGSYTDLWRKAREFGDFVSVGGLVYPEFERCVLPEDEAHPLVVKRGGQFMMDPEFVRSLPEVVIGIDPGIRNAGIVCVGFDDELVAYVFDEVLLQDKIVKDYAVWVRDAISRWQLRDPFFVCDPAARSRGQVDAEKVINALAKEDIFCNPGQNDRETGFDQMRARMAHGRFWVSPSLNGLRDEADDYAGKEPKEGEDDSHLDAIKGNDHRLDALRYAVMERFWDASSEDEAPKRNLGWQPGQDVPASPFSGGRQGDALPLGSMM